MTVIFMAKTNEGHTIKILSDLLKAINKGSCKYVVDKDKISLRMADSDSLMKILIDFQLNSDNFSPFKFKLPDKLFLGITQSHIHKMLKNIKKKDSINLFIDNKNPKDLVIKIIPKDKNRVTTSVIKFHDFQNLDIDLPAGYDRSIIIPSNEFQKLCKELGAIDSKIIVTSKKYSIKFFCDSGNVYSRQVEFSTRDDDIPDDSDSDENEDEYTQEFYSEQIVKISGIAGLSSNMQIFQKEGLPLLFKSSVGTLGKISIYVKTKQQIEEEERQQREEN
jgi:proliferating cell nuclear antigen